MADVADDLSAIWQLKILVSEVEYDASGVVTLNYGGKKASAKFDMYSY